MSIYNEGKKDTIADITQLIVDMAFHGATKEELQLAIQYTTKIIDGFKQVEEYDRKLDGYREKYSMKGR